MLNDILQFRADITNASYLSGVQWTAVWLCTIHYSKSSLQLYTSGRVQSTLLTQANQWLKSLTITILTLFMPTITVIITSHQHVLTVGVLCTAITDEGSRRLPKCLKFVTLLASVYEPQSCQNYLVTQDCSKEKYVNDGRAKDSCFPQPCLGLLLWLAVLMVLG